MKTFLQNRFILAVVFAGIFNTAQSQTQAKPDSPVIDVVAKVDEEASFPGGPRAWQKYIAQQITNHLDVLGKKDYGTCKLKFIVDSTGRISDVEATTMKKTKLAQIAVAAIENGPMWIPAQKDGKPVNAYRLQPVTLSPFPDLK